VVAVTICAIPTDVAASTPHRTYSLPSDGWKPGAPAFTALVAGAFEAKLTRSGACAGLGSTNALWPAGYRVRLHPVELIAPSGAVVAHQGERLEAGGAVVPTNYHGNRCASGGQTDLIMSAVSREQLAARQGTSRRSGSEDTALKLLRQERLQSDGATQGSKPLIPG
jgi:hypothetical protein